LRALEQGIELAEGERESTRERPKPTTTPPVSGKRPLSQHDREESPAEPAPGAVLVHRARAYMKRRPPPKATQR